MPTFILGAGFNADAQAEAGLCGLENGYPLIGEMARLCFGRSDVPNGQSIENLFDEALRSGKYKPVKELAACLRYADHYIARNLATQQTNLYRSFFEAFSESHFLTFNYDSLPETILFHLERWYPWDGYGVKVVADVIPGSEELAPRKSSSLVLHLHGSLCVRTSKHKIERRPGDPMPILRRREPEYIFDADCNLPNFPGVESNAGRDDVKDRIIAPVPDKAHGLKQPFIDETYRRALALMSGSDVAVAIGYSFNPHDRGSYVDLLRALGHSKHQRLVVISPDAEAIADRIRPDYPNLSVDPLQETFRQWAGERFPRIG